MVDKNKYAVSGVSIDSSPIFGNAAAGRNLSQVIADLPAVRRERIDARYRELRWEVEVLRELRQIATRVYARIQTWFR